MGRVAKIHRTTDDAENCPTAWFCALERAREIGDFARAAEAQRQLKRLGVRVRFTRRRCLREATVGATATSRRRAHV